MILYRAYLKATESGLEVWFEQYHLKRETKCFYICKREFSSKEKRISKTSTRFAFKSKELAIENLRIRKLWQISHAEREAQFARAFLDSEIKPNSMSHVGIPNTSELVSEHLNFDC